jgi:hypothetical protein
MMWGVGHLTPSAIRPTAPGEGIDEPAGRKFNDLTGRNVAAARDDVERIAS